MNKAEIVRIDPFVTAAIRVLCTEMGTDAVETERWVDDSPMRCEDATVLIGVIGDLKGQFMLSMPAATATGIVGLMMGETVTELDAMGQSALAELGNMMAGLATVLLEGQGCSANITPPTVMTGSGTEITTFGNGRAVAALATGFGALSVHVAVSET